MMTYRRWLQLSQPGYCNHTLNVTVFSLIKMGWGSYNINITSILTSMFLLIRYFLMLVATGSFSPERGLPVIFCVDFNHFKSIMMSALLHRKTLICSFLNQFRLLFICYQRKFNLLKPSLWICHSKALKHD